MKILSFVRLRIVLYVHYCIAIFRDFAKGLYFESLYLRVFESNTQFISLAISLNSGNRLYQRYNSVKTNNFFVLTLLY